MCVVAAPAVITGSSSVAAGLKPGASLGSTFETRGSLVLGALTAAFVADARPGLILDHGRVILANESALRLLGESRLARGLFEFLRASVECSRRMSHAAIGGDSGTFSLEFQPSGESRDNPIRVCYLVRQFDICAFESLSKREKDVIQLLGEGLTNQQIAKGLGISIETVRKHVSNALGKTGTKTRAGLVARTLQHQKPQRA
jgi:DNA-binding CsgD family transcriptional regulator